MLNRIRPLFKTPRFEDEILTMQARLLHFLLLLVLFYNVLLCFTSWNTPQWHVPLIGTALGMFCFYLLHQRRQLKFATTALLVMGWLLITSTFLTTGGVRSPNIVGYVLILGLAAVLLS
jgi:hypothetical protein